MIKLIGGINPMEFFVFTDSCGTHVGYIFHLFNENYLIAVQQSYSNSPEELSEGL